MPERDKRKWKSVMTTEFMSSEESDPENPKTFLKRSIPWRARKVTDFFYDLDKSLEERRSGQGKRQRNVRALSGEGTSRMVPESRPGAKVPSWAVVANTEQ